MKGIFGLSAAAVLAVTASASAAGWCLNHGIHCIFPPPADCPDCSSPCDRGHHHCSTWKCEHTRNLIEDLSSDCCCDRITAARKLGCRLHADFCCSPEVLDVLTHALLCDPCWEVRRAAAWSIAMQRARVEQGVLALYVSSKLDPHFLVRDKAADSLDVLLVCRKDCFKDFLASADALIKELKKNQFKPGTGNCEILFQLGCSACGLAVGTPVSQPSAVVYEKATSLVPKPGTRLPEK
jgi:hypothetical protein